MTTNNTHTGLCIRIEDKYKINENKSQGVVE